MSKYKILNSNHKLSLNNGSYRVVGISLTPSTFGKVIDSDGKRVNNCNWATKGSISTCVLWFAGRTVTHTVRNAMEDRTNLLVNNENEFYRQLDSDVAKLEGECKRDNAIPVIRPNTASDRDWIHLANRYPDITFYDYTKSIDRARAYAQGLLPDNYHITYSISEKSNKADCLELLRAGVNCALVVDTIYNGQQKHYGPIPSHWNRFSVIDGDTHDLRIPSIDGQGKVIALRLKGTNRSRALGRYHGFAKQFRLSLDKAYTQIDSSEYKTSERGVERWVREYN